MIRIFHGGEGGAHRYKLFNLENDLGEKHNLAAKQPGQVVRLDALIESFLEEAKAVRPVVNPRFDPSKYNPKLEGVGRIRKPARRPNAPPRTK